jgi:fructose-bisphosphate aldolase class I
MNAIGRSPWELSFSFGRALQEAALKAWGGKPANIDAAKRAFHHRAQCNGAARSGGYTEEMESAA